DWSDEQSIALHIAVADTGIGVPGDKQSLIFEAFQQVDGSSTRKYGGTGLGLTISAQIVQIMGGQIWVDSDAGRGSTFHFIVRFERVRALPRDTECQPSSLAPKS
ncbi:MAG: ATP-binding protein, partial [Candidatus Dormibacteraceae bacterium]